MRIYIIQNQQSVPPEFPAVTLALAYWDDFGFKTTYSANYWPEAGNCLALGEVKIMRMDMVRGTPNLPDVNEVALPDDCASLGTDYSYYETLAFLPDESGPRILEALRDLGVDATRRARFETQDAYTVSLIRLSPARDALNRLARVKEGVGEEPQQAPNGSEALLPPITGTVSQMLDNIQSVAHGIAEVNNLPLNLGFTPPAGKGRWLSPESITFNFSGSDDLPNKLIALVGPNGTGKTTLLADLALALFFGDDEKKQNAYGTVKLVSGSVRDVIFISYSAYDKFMIPTAQEISSDARSELAEQGYVYVGLRKLSAEHSQARDVDKEHTLKSISAIDLEFFDLLGRIFHDEGTNLSTPQPNKRKEIFCRAITELFKDPSLLALGLLPPDAPDEQIPARLTSLFPELSTGHKALLNIVGSLCLHLNYGSLVLIDEPEAHLHPPLIGMLLKIIRSLLRAFDAYAIVATHSPVVIQETLGQHVIKFRRIEDKTHWKTHPTQTFGENIATLTRETFGMPAALADYIGILEDRLKADPSLENLESLFGDMGLSSPARAQALRLIAKFRLEPNT